MTVPTSSTSLGHRHDKWRPPLRCKCTLASEYNREAALGQTVGSAYVGSAYRAAAVGGDFGGMVEPDHRLYPVEVIIV
jgi:hypothetical protein